MLIGAGIGDRLAVSHVGAEFAGAVAQLQVEARAVHVPGVLGTARGTLREMECLFTLGVFTNEPSPTLVDVGVVGWLDAEAVQHRHQRWQ